MRFGPIQTTSLAVINSTRLMRVQSLFTQLKAVAMVSQSHDALVGTIIPLVVIEV